MTKTIPTRLQRILDLADYVTTKKADRFYFDAGRPVKPFTFEIEREKEREKEL